MYKYTYILTLLYMVLWNIRPLLTLDGDKTLAVHYLWSAPRLLQLNPLWSTNVYSIELQHLQNSLARVVFQQSKTWNDHSLKHFYVLFIGCLSNYGAKSLQVGYPDKEDIQATSMLDCLSDLISAPNVRDPNVIVISISSYTPSNTITTALASRAFIVCLSVIWNSLPESMQSCDF